jgi:hypothetical protein
VPNRSVGRSRWRIDTFDLLVLLAFLALSMWTVFVLTARQTSQHVWTGTNGLYFRDQMQYLGWIRDSARHVLIGNPFITAHSPHDYLNPGLAISGALVRLGVRAWLSYLIWTPVAAVGLFVAVRTYVRQLVVGTAKRRFALVLALFYISPVAGLAEHFHWNQVIFVKSMALEMWPGNYLWGYPFTAITVALMVGAFIAYERDRRDGRVRPWAPLCALFCSWFQPWQGATLLLVVVVSEALLLRRRQPTPPALMVVTAVGGAIPLVYYFLLSHLDASWSLSGHVNLLQGLPWLDLLATLLPLGAFAVLAYWKIPTTFQDCAVRVWPLGALGILWFIQVSHVGTFPKHTLQGLSVPLAILAVIGAARLRLGLSASSRVILASVLVAALMAFAVGRQLDEARSLGAPTIVGSAPFFLNNSQSDALNYLDRAPLEGSVLSSVYLGQIVPAETGRKTWVGIASWTPNYQKRIVLADQLFSGKLSALSSVALVRSTGARFLLSDCRYRADLSPLLDPILRSVRHFGCATVYTVRTGG